MKPDGRVVILCSTIGLVCLSWWWLGPLLGIGVALACRGLAEGLWLWAWRRQTAVTRQTIEDISLATIKTTTEEVTRQAITEYLRQVLKTAPEQAAPEPMERPAGRGH